VEEKCGAQAVSQPVIDGERRGDDGPVGLVRRQGTEGGGIPEEQRDVTDILDVDVVHDGMGVVEMEAVEKMVRVGNGRRDQQKNPEEVDPGIVRYLHPEIIP
jgi:hypothetical protein